MLLPLAMWLGRTGVERALLVGSLFVVLIAELLNTGIEKAVDRVSQETHDLSKFAKDAGSAAVGLALIQCVIVWLAVLLDRFQIS
jgi:diacylglycerol kinase (ATP)